MSILSSTGLFPLTVDFVITKELLRKRDIAANDAFMPRWFRLGLFATAYLCLGGLCVLILVGSLHSRIDATRLLAFLPLVAFGLLWILVERRRRRKMQNLVGTRISAIFFEDGIEFDTTPKVARIGYSNIKRVGRDANGIVVILKTNEVLYFPVFAFPSEAQVEALFAFCRTQMSI
jgi:hypothetical protein